MFGIPTFDLLTDSGKQSFVEYVVNLMRNEIVSYTSSYINSATNITIDLTPYATIAMLTAHEADTTNVHGIVDTSDLLTTADLNGVVYQNTPYLDFDTVTPGASGIGQLAWNDTTGTLEFILKGGNVPLDIGQENVALVKHADNTGLTKGKVVYVAGSDGTNKTVRYAQANSEATSSKTFGVMAEDATGGNKGFVCTQGIVSNINTIGLTEGAAVYVSPTTAGDLTSTKPSAPNHMVLVGFCVRSHAVNGVLYISVINGFELQELHNVSINAGTLANGDILKYNTSTQLWENSISGAGVPIGTIIWTGQGTIPSGFLDCDGSSQLRSAYPDLFAAISTTYGQGSNPGTTFALPNVSSTTGNYAICAQVSPVTITSESLIAVPIGTLQLYAGSVYPTGWLRADGSAISRTTYADLFSIIGTTYGSGDGATTFNLPNLLSSGTGSPVYIIKVLLSGSIQPSTIAHAASHIRGGTDVIDADRAQIDYVPTTYTRNSAASEAGAVTDLTAHLSGINNAYLPLSGGTMTGAINSASTLNLATGGTNRLNINSSGHVNMPNQPRFFVANEGGATISATNKHTWNYVITNVGNCWSSVNNRFTAPVTGDYFFSYSILNSIAAALYIEFRKNGSVMTAGTYPRGYVQNQYAPNTASGIITLNANDYIEIWVNTGTAHSYHSFFTGYLLA